MKHYPSDEGPSATQKNSAAMTVSLRHIALFVPDLRAAGQYHQAIFEMALIGRETLL